MYRLTTIDNLVLEATATTHKNKWVSISKIYALRVSIALSVLTCCTVATGKDDVQYKPRDYTPSKTLRSNTYEPKTYAPKPQTSSKQFEGKSADSKTFADPKSLSEKTMDATTPFTGKTVDKPSAVEGKIYKQGESAFPSTISVDKSLASQEKKPFLVSSNSSPFIVTERPEEKNPLLEPKQGIKAPVETPPTKDENK
ncbi:MAG: hypothetical protein WCJ02_00800 [bacterium]